MRHLRNSLFYIIPAIILFCSSCKKDDPQPQTGTPVFHARGMIGGQPFNLEAGVNEYYMFSSCPSDANSIYKYTGELKKRNCTSSCGPHLLVRINDYQDHISGPTSPSIALAPAYYNFALTPALSSLTAAFSPVILPGDSLLACSWSFGSNLSNPTHTFAAAGDYAVTFTASIMHNNMVTTASAMDTVHIANSPCMNIDFTATDIDQISTDLEDSLLFTPTINGGIAPYSCNWFFGDSFNGNGNPVVHGYNPEGVFPVLLHVTDASGCEQWRTRNVRTPSSDSTLVNFNWQMLPATNLSLVEIEWTDANGNLYSSTGGIQPSTSSFQIISQEEYTVNENQEATKKIHLLVTCTLFNGANSLLLQNADIVFAVAHH